MAWASQLVSATPPAPLHRGASRCDPGARVPCHSGKLALYCAAGGIAPHRVMPVMLDVGTNNKELLSDPAYVGIAKPRLEGDEYYDMVDEFMEAV